MKHDVLLVESVTFPSRAIEEVFHVGTLNAADKGFDSYEGHGLSVSNRPDAWVRIARLGGRPLWKATKRTGTFMDNKALTPAHRKTMLAWAHERGYVERDGTTMTSAFQSHMHVTIIPQHHEVYVRGLVAVAYAEAVLKWDGVWWTAPTRGLSAPRGVIVPSMVSTWEWTKVADSYPK